MKSSRSLYLVLSIVTLVVISAELGAYYYLEGSNRGIPSSTSVLCNYKSADSSGADTIIVNALINYGNGTMTWYNQTVVPPNWNAYALTMYVTKCNIQTVFYGQPYNEHLVTSINGVNQHGTLSWSLWTFCFAQRAWTYSQVGVDLVVGDYGVRGPSLTYQQSGYPGRNVVGENSPRVIGCPSQVSLSVYRIDSVANFLLAACFIIAIQEIIARRVAQGNPLKQSQRSSHGVVVEVGQGPVERGGKNGGYAQRICAQVANLHQPVIVDGGIGYRISREMAG